MFYFDFDVAIDVAKFALPGKEMQKSISFLTNENECYVMK